MRTHTRSRSDATGLQPPSSCRIPPPELRPRLQLGDLMSGRAFDNGCHCLESRQAAVNELRGKLTHCACNAPRLQPQLEFLKVSHRVELVWMGGGDNFFFFDDSCHLCYFGNFITQYSLSLYIFKICYSESQKNDIIVEFEDDYKKYYLNLMLFITQIVLPYL